MTYHYTPRGVCSRSFEIDLKDGVIEDVRIAAGCPGNLQGIASLVRGQRAEDVIERLRGIHCEHKNTSCPDQLSIALSEALALETAATMEGGGSADD